MLQTTPFGLRLNAFETAVWHESPGPLVLVKKQPHYGLAEKADHYNQPLFLWSTVYSNVTWTRSYFERTPY